MLTYSKQHSHLVCRLSRLVPLRGKWSSLSWFSVAFTLEYPLKGLNAGFCMLCSCLIHCYWDCCLLSTSRRWLSRLTYLCLDSLWEQWMLSSCLDSCLEGKTSYWTHTTSFCGPARNSVPSATNVSPGARDDLMCSGAELGLTFCHFHCCHSHCLLQNQLHPLTRRHWGPNVTS